jgi:flagellar motor switch protein FliN/FliY
MKEEGISPKDREVTELSEEEIRTLLGEGIEIPPEAFTQQEKEELTKVSEPAMSAAAAKLSTILNRKVDITNPHTKVDTPEEIRKELPKNAIVVEVEYAQDVVGPTYIIFLKDNAAVLADLIMGGDGTKPPSEMTELYLGALGEALAKMMDSATAVLSNIVDKEIKCGKLKTSVVDFTSPEASKLLVFQQKSLVKVNYDLKIGDLVEGKLIQLLPPSIAKPIMEGGTITAAKEVKKPERIAVSPVSFAPFKPQPEVVTVTPPNIQLLMDVPMEVTVELGRTTMKVEDILQLAPGKIVELECSASEPVNILVNGKLVGRGTVVVVEDSFGVRITDIFSPEERLESLGRT